VAEIYTSRWMTLQERPLVDLGEEVMPAEAKEEEKPKRKSKPRKPQRKVIDKKVLIKRIRVAGIIVIVLLAVMFLPRLLVPSAVTHVDIEILNMPMEESVDLILTVETSAFSKTYTGMAEVIVEYDDNKTIIPVKIEGGDAIVCIPYSDFYEDNGLYSFTMEIDGKRDTAILDLMLTAHYAPLSAQPWDDAKKVSVVFDLWSSQNGRSLMTAGIQGNATIVIYNDTNLNEPLAWRNLSVSGTSYSISGSSTVQMAASGGYNISIPYSDFALKENGEYTKNATYTIALYFTNKYPIHGEVSIQPPSRTFQIMTHQS